MDLVGELLDMMLIDAPLLNKPCTGVLLMVRLYNTGVPVFISSICTSCMDCHSQSESVSIKNLCSCSASSSV